MVILQETTLIRIEMFHHRTTEAKGSVKYERMISSESSQCVVRGNQMLSPQTQLNPTLSRFHNMVCWQKTSEQHIPMHLCPKQNQSKDMKQVMWHLPGQVSFVGLFRLLSNGAYYFVYYCFIIKCAFIFYYFMCTILFLSFVMFQLHLLSYIFQLFSMSCQNWCPYLSNNL